MARAKHLGSSRKTALQTGRRRTGAARGHRVGFCLLNNHLRAAKNKKRHSLVKQKKWRFWLLVLGGGLVLLIVWGMLTEIRINNF